MTWTETSQSRSNSPEVDEERNIIFSTLHRRLLFVFSFKHASFFIPTPNRPSAVIIAVDESRLLDKKI